MIAEKDVARLMQTEPCPLCVGRGFLALMLPAGYEEGIALVIGQHILRARVCPACLTLGHVHAGSVPGSRVYLMFVESAGGGSCYTEKAALCLN